MHYSFNQGVVLNVIYSFFPLSNDAAQSDDDDKSQTQLTEADGGKLKQRT